MILANRTLFVLVVCLSAVLAGCGGGGSSPGPSQTPVPTSTPTPHVSEKPTAVPTPSATPTLGTAPALSSDATRPLAAGDTFTYAGTTLDSFVYNGASPNPSAMIAYTVGQSVDDMGPAPFANATPFDLHTVETDASPNQTITVTTDTYLANIPASANVTDFDTYGYASTVATTADILSYIPLSTTSINETCLGGLPLNETAHEGDFTEYGSPGSDAATHDLFQDYIGQWETGLPMAAIPEPATPTVVIMMISIFSLRRRSRLRDHSN